MLNIKPLGNDETWIFESSLIDDSTTKITGFFSQQLDIFFIYLLFVHLTVDLQVHYNNIYIIIILHFQDGRHLKVE